MKKELIKAWLKLFTFAVTFSIMFIVSLHGILYAIDFLEFSMMNVLISLAFVNVFIFLLFGVSLVMILKGCKKNV